MRGGRDTRASRVAPPTRTANTSAVRSIVVRVLGVRDEASDRRRILVRALLVASALVTAGVAFRVQRTGSLDTTNLVWNLFLAWIPFVLALVLYDGARHGSSTHRAASAHRALGLGFLWLLFLPNAPYIVTDAKWLDEYQAGALWYDTLLVGAAATVGLVLGFVSLYLVQAVAARRLGAVGGWVVAWAALVLSGLGVYLGRFQRWNSWELFTEPGKILGGLVTGAFDPLAHARPLAWSMFFAVALCVGYTLFTVVFRSQLERMHDR